MKLAREQNLQKLVWNHGFWKKVIKISLMNLIYEYLEWGTDSHLEPTLNHSLKKKNRRDPAVGWEVQSVVAFRPLDRRWGVRRKNKQSEKALNSWREM